MKKEFVGKINLGIPKKKGNSLFRNLEREHTQKKGIQKKKSLPGIDREYLISKTISKIDTFMIEITLFSEENILTIKMKDQFSYLEHYFSLFCFINTF